MKKVIIFSAILISNILLSQGTLHVFNYSPYAVDYTLVAKNNSNPSGNCSPIIESMTSVLPRLKPAIDPYNIPTEAFYSNATTPPPYAFNLSNTYNSAYPATPLIDKWSNGTITFTVPSGILNTYGASTSWAFSKFQMVDVSVPGVSTYLGGDTVGNSVCGGLISPVSGAYYYSEWYTVGGDIWWVIQ